MIITGTPVVYKQHMCTHEKTLPAYFPITIAFNGKLFKKSNIKPKYNLSVFIKIARPYQFPLEPAVRLELTTVRLQGGCSTAELSRPGTRPGARTPNQLLTSQLLYRLS